MRKPADRDWQDIDWLRSITKIRLLLKGILRPEDADLALQYEVDGVIVSNHGARNLDTVVPTIDALPETAERVGGRVPILVDGGIRRGTDVLKSIARGAAAVLIGRSYAYALSIGGAEGVAHCLRLLRSEFEFAMAATCVSAWLPSRNGALQRQQQNILAPGCQDDSYGKYIK